jgi:hypothetical protein
MKWKELIWFPVVALMLFVLVLFVAAYAWYVALMIAALGLWVAIPAILFPAVCIWLAHKVAQW